MRSQDRLSRAVREIASLAALVFPTSITFAGSGECAPEGVSVLQAQGDPNHDRLQASHPKSSVTQKELSGTLDADDVLRGCYSEAAKSFLRNLPKMCEVTKLPPPEADQILRGALTAIFVLEAQQQKIPHHQIRRQLTRIGDSAKFDPGKEGASNLDLKFNPRLFEGRTQHFALFVLGHEMGHGCHPAMFHPVLQEGYADVTAFAMLESLGLEAFTPEVRDQLLFVESAAGELKIDSVNPHKFSRGNLFRFIQSESDRGEKIAWGALACAFNMEIKDQQTLGAQRGQGSPLMNFGFVESFYPRTFSAYRNLKNANGSAIEVDEPVAAKR